MRYLRLGRVVASGNDKYNRAVGPYLHEQLLKRAKQDLLSDL